MSNENPKPSSKASELDLGIDTLQVLDLAARVRKTGESWPVSLAKGLGYNAALQVKSGDINRLLVYGYYIGFLNTIENAEKIIKEGTKPGSDLIFSFTNDVVEQAEYFMEVQDEQLSAMQALFEDPSGIKLLAMKLSNFTEKALNLDQKVAESINSLIGQTIEFRDIIWETVDIPKDSNLTAFAWMRAFDDYRRFWTQMEDKFTVIDSAI